jgi:hypothetical protein
LSIFYNVYPNNTVTQTVANPVSWYLPDF